MAQLPPHPSIVLVREFIDAIDRLDTERARKLSALDARYVSPGGTETGSLDEIVVRLGQRYRQVGKKIERFDRVEMPDGDVVFVSGSLHGAWEDGAPFDNVRFVDRFEIRGGKIASQEVWNDAGEARARRAAAAGPARASGQGDRAMLAMASEVERLRERLGNLERLLAAKGLLSAVELEAHGMDEADTVPDEGDPLSGMPDFLGAADDEPQGRRR
ncbi:MAG: nuclear transport factor 2 family protein [Tagaea sp.]|nr:nuclear transport factor 2 family protein [Tagaea sp.]